MSTTPLTDSINALTTYANEVTGASDTTLSDAVYTLAQGYGGGGLPSEYQQVDYIQGTGTQCIDTGYKPSTDTDLFMIKGSNDGSIYTHIFGAGDSYDQYGLNGSYFNYYTSMNNAVSGQNNACSIWIKSGVLYIDGTPVCDKSSITGYTTRQNLAIFCRTKSTTGEYERFVAMKLYSLKLWDNQTLIRDMIPCYRKSDMVIGMYDLVNGVFYTNAGTGTFSKGMDL